MAFALNPTTGKLDVVIAAGNGGTGVSTAIIIDTRDTIIQATTEPAGTLGYATDVNKFFVYDGTNWREDTFTHPARTALDMGVDQNSSRIGYSPTTLTDKILYNIRILGSSVEKLGGFRLRSDVTPEVLEVYKSNGWEDILTDINFAIRSELEHTPLTETIDIWSGNSNLQGSNNEPLIQQYQVSMGSNQKPSILYGGDF